MDKRLRDLMMMILVKQTEEFDMMLYMAKTDMLMLVAEIEVGDKTADDVDKGEEVFVSQEVPLKEVSVVDEVNVVSTATTTTAIIDDSTLAKAFMEIKSAKPKADKDVIQELEQGLVIHEQEQAPTSTVSLQQPSQVKVQDKGKGKMVKPEPVKKLSNKDQLMLDEELAFKLQVGEEEERLSRGKAQQIEEINIAWDDIQTKIDADYQLAQRMQAEEQEELTDKEKARLFKMFDRAFKRVNTFLDYMTELVVESSKEAEAEVTEGSSKRAREELEQENAKKQKMKDDKEYAELKQFLEIIPKDKDNVTIDATPLSSKYLTIIYYKIYKEKKKSYF
nr:hypothetical protein [Tanacetum cinerariifolium]